jgi:hypothetical protein
MHTRQGLAIGAAALALAASSGLAADARDAQIIRGGEQRIEVKRLEVPVHTHNTRRLTKVVLYQAEDRIITAAKSRAMVDQQSDILHVEVVHENVFLRRDGQYIRQHDYAVNPNDLIPSAHRLALNLTAEPAKVIWGGPAAPAAGHVSVEPLFILDKPESLEPAPAKPRAPKIPNVPQPPKKSERPLVAQK